MQFSDTVNRTGIVQLYEDETETNGLGSVTIGVKTREINNAFAEYNILANTAAGTQQADDVNHTGRDYIEFDLVENQIDYSYSVDGDGNEIEDFYRLEMRIEDNTWVRLNPFDEMAEDGSIAQRETETGVPCGYSKSGNTFSLDIKPNYSKRIGTEGVSGFRMYISRSPSFFVVGDTTKEPGIPSAHHRYLAILPALWYWLPKDAQRASVCQRQVTDLESKIRKYYRDRKKDEQLILTSEQVNPF